MIHSTRLTLFVSAICRAVKSKFSRDEINSSPRNLIFLNISVHSCLTLRFVCVFRCNLCISQFHQRPLLTPDWPPGITLFLPWDEKRRQMSHPPSTLQHFSLIAFPWRKSLRPVTGFCNVAYKQRRNNAQTNTEIRYCKWNNKRVGFGAEISSAADEEDYKCISSDCKKRKNPSKNPKPGLHP